MLVVYMEGSTFVPFVQPGVMQGVEETMILAAGAGSAGFRRDRPKRTVKPFVHLYKTCLRECATRGAQKAIFCCNYGVDCGGIRGLLAESRRRLCPEIGIHGRQAGASGTDTFRWSRS